MNSNNVYRYLRKTQQQRMRIYIISGRSCILRARPVVIPTETRIGITTITGIATYIGIEITTITGIGGVDTEITTTLEIIIEITGTGGATIIITTTEIIEIETEEGIEIGIPTETGIGIGNLVETKTEMVIRKNTAGIKMVIGTIKGNTVEIKMVIGKIERQWVNNKQTITTMVIILLVTINHFPRNKSKTISPPSLSLHPLSPKKYDNIVIKKQTHF